MARIWAVLAVLTLAACQRAAPTGPVPHQIRIVGASAGLPFAEDVAERFTLSDNNSIAPLAQADGTASGIARFCGGHGIAFPDLVVATRRLSPSERATCAVHGVRRIAEVQFGWSALVLVTGNGDPAALTLRQAAAAISGNARRWSDIDASLPARSIAVFGPAARNASGDGLTLLTGASAPRTDGAYHPLGADAALVATTVSETAGAMGLLPFAYAGRPDLHAVAIDGVAPTRAAIASGRYPLRLPLYLIVKSGEARAVPGMPALLGLFARSLAAGGRFAGEGLVPLDAAGQAAARRALVSAGAAA